MVSLVIVVLLPLIFFSLANTSYSFIEPEVQAFLHPIGKDKTTNRYFVPLSIGDSISSHRFVIDLNGASPLLLDCSTAAKTTSYHPIKCGSTRCKYANPNFSCSKKSTCRSSNNAKLFRNTIDLLYTPNGLINMDSAKSSLLSLTCTDNATSLKYIPSGFDGTIGLADTHISIPSQLASMYKIPPKISLCLPSTEGMKSYSGDLWIGGGPFLYPSFRGDVSNIFSSTPLIGNTKSGPSGYLIDVKSIQIGGKTVPITPQGATKICTLAPYTVLHNSIYKALVKAFTGKTKMMANAPTVKPFRACFHSSGEQGVPVIDLVLRGGAKWKIHGSNSLVKVNKNVVCLGFVDGGVNPKYPIVIGGFQMEDNLVQFDHKASVFSFSSSLLLRNTSCSVSRFFGM